MRKIIITAIIACSVIACKTAKDPVKTVAADPPPPAFDCNSVAVATAGDIKAIIETNCSRCHNENMKAGYNFKTMESIKKAAASGQLLSSIKHEPGIEPMPAYADKLDDRTIARIECWINGGMK
jgi:mono/diheme cytochrome c family protein